MPKKGMDSFDPASLCQVAIVVKSIDETVKFYEEMFGIGPFEIIEVGISRMPPTTAKKRATEASGLSLN